MKYGKFLLAAATALTAFMAFAGIASAATLTSPAGTTYTSKIVATSTDSVLDSSSFGKIACPHSEVEGTVTKHGTTSTVVGTISKLTFGPTASCTGGKPTSPVVTTGTLEVHYLEEKGGVKLGTVTSSGAEVIVHETLVGTCKFKTSATDIGTFVSGTPAKLEIASSAIPQSGGDFFCPSSATWTGTYTVTSPGTLLLDK